MHKKGGLSDEAIEGVISRKVNDWLAHIDDKELREFIKDKIIVAGGSVASLLMGQKVNDFDVYFTTRDAAIRVAYYYLNRFAKNPSPSYQQSPVQMWVEVRMSDTDFGHRGRPVEVDDKGVMYLARRKSCPGDEVTFVDGPGHPPAHADDHEWMAKFHTGRVNIVVKSAGAACDTGDDGKYQYFETLPDPNYAIAYAQKVTAPLEKDTELALASQLCDMDEPPEDIDVEDIDHLTELAEAVAKEELPPKTPGCNAKIMNKYRPVFLSSNAITLSDGVQIVIRFYGQPNEIIKNFDFVHTTCWWASGMDERGRRGKVTYNLPALRSMQSYKLKYIGSRYPLCSLVRTRKFADRGWKVAASVFIKAMWQCTRLDWNNYVTWEDQLTGMDAAYFNQVLEILRADKRAGKTIDGTYVVELIDRMM